MLKSIIAGVSALALVTGAAWADKTASEITSDKTPSSSLIEGNQSFIDQDDDNNVADVDQDASKGGAWSLVEQEGNGRNEASVDQIDISAPSLRVNRSYIDQANSGRNDARNQASVSQNWNGAGSGDDNASAIIQRGGGNKADTDQRGGGLDSVIRQSGNGSSNFNTADVEQRGSDNLSFIQQDGAGNDADLEQRQFDQDSSIKQFGFNNDADVAQGVASNNAGNLSIVTQNGSDNSASVSQ